MANASRRQTEYSVHVANLKWDQNSEELKRLFSSAGVVSDVRIPPTQEKDHKKSSEKNKLYAFVRFRTPEEQQAAIAMFDGYELNGASIVCTYALKNEKPDYQSKQVTAALSASAKLNVATGTRKRNGTEMVGSKKVPKVTAFSIASVDAMLGDIPKRGDEVHESKQDRAKPNSSVTQAEAIMDTAVDAPQVQYHTAEESTTSSVAQTGATTDSTIEFTSFAEYLDHLNRRITTREVMQIRSEHIKEKQEEPMQLDQACSSRHDVVCGNIIQSSESVSQVQQENEMQADAVAVDVTQQRHSEVVTEGQQQNVAQGIETFGDYLVKLQQLPTDEAFKLLRIKQADDMVMEVTQQQQQQQQHNEFGQQNVAQVGETFGEYLEKLQQLPTDEAFKLLRISLFRK